MPHYREEVSLDASVPALATIYGRSILDTLHERVGDLDQLRTNVALGQSHMANGIWGRLIGTHGDHKGQPGGIYDGGPAYDTDLRAFQIGADLYRRQRESGRRDHAGLYGAYGKMDSDVDHSILGTSFRAGSVDMRGYTLGAYWTHYEPNGAYLDLVAQASWLDIDIESRRLAKISTEGFDLALSAEGGYPFKFDARWLLEPQAQLVYQSINIDGFDDGAADIRFRDLDSLAGRIGLRLARTGDTEGWLRVNLWHEFMGTPQTEFSSADGYIPFVVDLPETWIEIGAGASLRLDKRTTMFGSASYETTFEDDFKSYDLKIGIRLNW